MANPDFEIVISECENMNPDKVVILCPPNLRLQIEIMLDMIEMMLESNKEIREREEEEDDDGGIGYA